VTKRLNKWGRMTVILAVVALSCFIFAGMALAESINMVAGDNPVTGNPSYVVKADHTYAYTVTGTGMDIDVNLFAEGNLLGKLAATPDGSTLNRIVLDFPFGPMRYSTVEDPAVNDANEAIDPAYTPTLHDPENNNLAGLIGETVDVWVTVDNNGDVDEYLTKVIPELHENITLSDGSVIDRVYLTVERQLIPTIGRVTDFRIEGLVVRNTKAPKEDYCVNIKHSKSCFTPKCLNLDVVLTVGKITIDTIDDCKVAGARVNVTGHVYRTEGGYTEGIEPVWLDYPWPITTWPVIIEYVGETKNPVYPPCALCPAGTPYLVPVCVSDPNQGGIVDNGCLGEPYTHQNPVSDFCIAPEITHTVNVLDGQVIIDRGFFKDTIVVPGVAGVSHSIVARTIEVKDTPQDASVQYYFDTADYLVPVESLEDMAYVRETDDNHFLRGFFNEDLEALEHAWVYSDQESIKPVAGDPKYITIADVGAQVDCSAYVPVVITLRDKFGNETPNKVPCGDNLAALKIDLKSIVCDPDDPTGTINPEVPFGTILDGNGSGAHEIDYTQIAPGASSVTVYFKADEGGNVRIIAGAIINGVNQLDAICCLEVNCQICILEVTPLVPCDQIPTEYLNDPNYEEPAKAGWPVKISVHYDPALPGTILADPARTEATLRVELLDSPLQSVISEASWDLEAFTDGNRLAFNMAGSKGNNDTYIHPDDNYVNSTKSDFFVYVPWDYCGPLAVKVVDPEKHVWGYKIIEYRSPVELVRVLRPNSWQLVSTPKELAGDGTMESLLGGEYFSDMLIYDKNLPGGPWAQITDPAYQLRPQYGYLLNMTQDWTNGGYCYPEQCGSEDCVQARYVFARSIGAELPGSRPLNLGWNLVGPSFDEDIHYRAAEQLLTSYGEVTFPCTPNTSCVCGDVLTQGDTLSRMLGSACQDCKTLVNWGGKGLNGYTGLGPYGPVAISLQGAPNSMGNLGNYMAASVNGNTYGGYYVDSSLYGFNGDAYWLYITSPQTLTSNTILKSADVQP